VSAWLDDTTGPPPAGGFSPQCGAGPEGDVTGSRLPRETAARSPVAARAAKDYDPARRPGGSRDGSRREEERRVRTHVVRARANVRHATPRFEPATFSTLCSARTHGAQRAPEDEAMNRRTICVVACALSTLCTFDPGRAAAATAEWAGGVTEAAPLTFDARVAHQRRLEEVYWRHRVWPADNPRPKPPLEAVLSDAAIAARVRDTLQLSAALEAYWGRALTGALLQAEMERQARDSRRPAMLRELWAALGDDPRLVAEMLARPVVAERLARESFERALRATPSDMRAHEGDDMRAASFDAWWASVRDSVPPVPTEAAYAYRLPVIGRAHGADAWSPTFALPEAEVENTAVWTGAEMIVWGGTDPSAGGKTNSGSRYDPALDTWRPTSGVGAPEARKQHTAVWTGTEMIVWGGCGLLDEHRCHIGTGGRYDPASDTWRPVSHPGRVRVNPKAVWTGSEMIVWGGCAFVNNVCRPQAAGSEGLRYDPATDTWTATSAANAPAPRHFHTLLWTGNLMVAWGGRDDGLTEAFATGGRYDPATDTWAPTTLEGAPVPRYDHTAVWTGARMLVWGGSDGTRALATGRRYDPVNDAWIPIARAGAPRARAQHTAVWDGEHMIVWGGCPISDIGFCEDFLATGGRFDPRTNEWAPTSVENAPEPRYAHRAVWSGDRMIVWGGYRPDPFVTPRTGGRYDPESDTWSPTNAAEAPTGRVFHSAIWTGAEMIVWGGNDRYFGDVSTGGRYDPATDSWRRTRRAGAPVARSLHSAIWTGTEMIVWGGSSGSTTYATGGRYDPLLDAWTPTSTADAPAARRGHSALWTGSEMIVWGGSGAMLWMKTGARYDPATNAWTPTATAGAPVGRDGHTAVWTGSEMIVWGGNASTGSANTGGRYDPGANAWAPTSVVSAPSPRGRHAAVWTGSAMLVWGGSESLGDTFDFLGDGASYDPAADAWNTIALAGAPDERASFAYVWTGNRLVVWGGCNGAAGCSVGLDTGGEYSPADDSWTPTPLAGGPSARYSPSAVWTGDEMIVWGGVADEASSYTNHGARYVPTPPAGAR
jgi:N-acetylneuraminic acid mutarotase